MKTERIIDMEKLIEITVQFLVSEKLNPNDLDGSARGIDNTLGRLCSKFFGSYTFKNSMYLSTIWKRNKSEFKKRVKEQFLALKSDKKEHLDIDINQSEKNQIENLIVTFGDGRKRLSADFTNFVSKKLQANGIKCWLKCNSNWFLKENGRKKGDFWSGKYSCIECSSIYKLRIKKLPIEKIEVETILDLSSHQEFIEKKTNRISGEKRKILAQEIVSKGVGNFKTENFLSEKGFIEFVKKTFIIFFAI